MSFKSYMNKVDKLCVKVTGLTTSDFEDYAWRSNFDDEVPPGVALYYFLEDNGYVQRYPEIFSQYVEASEIS